MSLILHRIVMHKIDKTQHSTDAISTYRNEIYTNNEVLETLTISLAETYSKKTSKEYSNFRVGENTPPFKTILDNYLADTNDDTFLAFSRRATEQLSQKMNLKPASTGGFLVIVDYTNIHRFILIALVNKKEGYTEDNLDIFRIEQLNTDQLGMAGFINITNYLNDNIEYRPLSFMRGTREVSDYFSSFLGADSNIETSSHMTGVFINALKDFFAFQEYDLARKEQLSQAIYAFCDEKRQNYEPVNIAAVSALINPDNPNEFFEFTQDQERNYNLNTIIESINKQKLNNLKSFSIKGDGFRISFDRELYNNTIQLNENDELVVSGLPDDFIQQLRQEFTNQNE